MPAWHMIHTVFGNAVGSVGACFVEGIHDTCVVLQHTGVPTGVIVLANQIRHIVMGAVCFHPGQLGHDGEATGIHLLAKGIQIL